MVPERDATDCGVGASHGLHQPTDVQQAFHADMARRAALARRRAAA